MKEITVLAMLAIVLLIGLTGCAGQADNPAKSNQSDGNLVQTGNVGPVEQDDEELEVESTPNVLVAYFSATNNTAVVAADIADSLGADLYAIIPAEPYTAADLDYGNANSRTSQGMNDLAARPAISGSLDNMAEYDVVFIGYPIWWGQAPKIISTFLEAYDFSGKTIVPFCTSSSSGIGSSATNLQDLTAEATWLAGQRFAAGASHESIVEWLDGLDLALEVE